jgi:hypothetical protein
MKTLLPVAFAALLWSTGASSQPATFSTENGRLEIPTLTVDGRVALTDVELMITNPAEPAFALVDFELKPFVDNDPQEYTLEFGKGVSLQPNQELHFIGVLAESRCPSDVVCIHAGEVTVILRMLDTLPSGNTVRTDFGLTLLGTDISYFEHKGVYFRLTEVEPYPVSTQQIAEEDYTIVFEYQSIPFKF